MKSTLYILIGCLLLTNYACKKKNAAPSAINTPTNNQSVSFDFNYSGKQWAYQKISFSSTLSDTASVIWDFGNGLTSNKNHPDCSYKVDSIYKVTLTYQGVSISKSIDIGLHLDSLISRYTLWNRFTNFKVEGQFGSFTTYDTMNTVVNISPKLSVLPQPPSDIFYPYEIIITDITKAHNYTFPVAKFRLCSINKEDIFFSETQTYPYNINYYKIDLINNRAEIGRKVEGTLDTLNGYYMAYYRTQ
jgi:hypothetical protein